MDGKNDLIRRQDAIDAICQDWCLCNHSECKHTFDMKKDESYWCDGCTDVNVLMQLPSAQPEIIRCKDCKYNYGLTHGGDFNPEDIVCTYFDTDGMQCYDFCSCAERIEVTE